MEIKRPSGVTFIGYFYIFGSVVLILSLFLFNNFSDQFGIAVRFGLPNVPENIMRVLVAIIFLIISYGYLKLKKWSIIVLLYTFSKRRYFINK